MFQIGTRVKCVTGFSDPRGIPPTHKPTPPHLIGRRGSVVASFADRRKVLFDEDKGKVDNDLTLAYWLSLDELEGDNMKLNSEKLKQAVRGVGQNKVAAHLGYSAQNMSEKMKRPERLRIDDFLLICQFLKEKSAQFIIDEDNSADLSGGSHQVLLCDNPPALLVGDTEIPITRADYEKLKMKMRQR